MRTESEVHHMNTVSSEFSPGDLAKLSDCTFHPEVPGTWFEYMDCAERERLLDRVRHASA